MMDVSIIVVSYNTRDLLRSCLQSLPDTVRGLSYEVLVVDNASTDGSPETVAAEFPEAILIRNADNRGFAAANNQALVVASGRHVLLLNSDAVLLAGTLRRMVGVLETHPWVGIVGAQLLNPDGSFQHSYADFPSVHGELLLATKLSRLVHAPTYPSYPAERSQHERTVDWVSGACLLARRAAIDEIGPLDESYFMYTEETDWCYRMRRAGWLVYYLPSARVLHWGGQSASRVPERKRSQLYRSKQLFFRKHHGALAAATFALSVRLVSALKLLLWAGSSLTPAAGRRQQALAHARSYALLLSEL